MPVRPVPTDGPINLAILYPTVWFGDADALARRSRQSSRSIHDR